MAQLIVKNTLAAWVVEKKANILLHSQTLGNAVWVSTVGFSGRTSYDVCQV